MSEALTLYPTPDRRLRCLHHQLQDALQSFEMAGPLACDAHVPPELAQDLEHTAARIRAHVQDVAQLRMQLATEADCGC